MEVLREQRAIVLRAQQGTIEQLESIYLAMKKINPQIKRYDYIHDADLPEAIKEARTKMYNLEQEERDRRNNAEALKEQSLRNLLNFTEKKGCSFFYNAQQAYKKILEDRRIVAILIPQDSVLMKLQELTGRDMKLIMDGPIMASVFLNHFSERPVFDVEPAFVAITGLGYGKDRADINRSVIISYASPDGSVKMGIVSMFLIANEQVEKLRLLSQPVLSRLTQIKNIDYLILTNLWDLPLLTTTNRNSIISTIERVVEHKELPLFFIKRGGDGLLKIVTMYLYAQEDITIEVSSSEFKPYSAYPRQVKQPAFLDPIINNGFSCVCGYVSENGENVLFNQTSTETWTITQSQLTKFFKVAETKASKWGPATNLKWN